MLLSWLDLFKMTNKHIFYYLGILLFETLVGFLFKGHFTFHESNQNREGVNTFFFFFFFFSRLGLPCSSSNLVKAHYQRGM